MPIKALRFSDRVCARLAKRIAAGLHLCKRRGAASRYLKVLREKLARDSLRRLLSRGMHDWQKRERKGPSLSFFKKGAGSNIGIVLAGPWDYDSSVLCSSPRREGTRGNSDFLKEILKPLRTFVRNRGNRTRESSERCLRSKKLKWRGCWCELRPRRAPREFAECFYEVKSKKIYERHAR